MAAASVLFSSNRLRGGAPTRRGDVLFRATGAGRRRLCRRECTPHFLFDLAEKKTGRTRKGYAASVSGRAANGCAMHGPKEKNASR